MKGAGEVLVMVGRGRSRLVGLIQGLDRFVLYGSSACRCDEWGGSPCIEHDEEDTCSSNDPTDSTPEISRRTKAPF